MKHIYFGFFSLLLISSCEGMRCGSGEILDALTNEPLDSVFCEVLTNGGATYSDSTGAYDVCNYIGGCFPQCRDIEINFSKEGYESLTLINPTDGTPVLMEPE